MSLRTVLGRTPSARLAREAEKMSLAGNPPEAVAQKLREAYAAAIAEDNADSALGYALGAAGQYKRAADQAIAARRGERLQGPETIRRQRQRERHLRSAVTMLRRAEPFSGSSQFDIAHRIAVLTNDAKVASRAVEDARMLPERQFTQIRRTTA
jgi:hypothetical protein